MGYYTKYSAEVQSQVKGLDITNALEATVSFDYEFTLNDLVKGVLDEMKWYSHEQEMRAFTRQYPGVLITLHGEGEESGDIWRKYFLDGKMQLAKAQINYAPFDEKELR